jgi:uncharacterized protein
LSDPSLAIFFLGFCSASILGAVIAYSGFCTFGAIADWVSFGDRGRLGAWLLAIGTAICGVAFIETTTTISLDHSVLPYTSPSFNPARYLIGGLIFGIGMHLSGGCSSKALVRLGSGNLQGLVVCSFAAITSYLLIYGTLFEEIFYPLLAPFLLSLEDFGMRSQRLGELVIHTEKESWLYRNHPFLIGLTVSVYSLTLILKSSRSKLVISGATIGALVVGGWFLTGSELGEAWVEEMSFRWHPPRNLGLQSFTFVSPLADFVGLVFGSERHRSLTFGLFGAFGVCFGSFVYHGLTRQLRLNRFISIQGALRAALGGILLGTGGVLAVGCSIGQGITGMSTLALGSLVATVSMGFSAAFAVRVEYHQILQSDDGSRATKLRRAVISSLIDFHLLPKSWRPREGAIS